MYVITNMTNEPLPIDGVSLDPKQQLEVGIITAEMAKAQAAGKLRALSADETPEERKALVDSLKPLPEC